VARNRGGGASYRRRVLGEIPVLGRLCSMYRGLARSRMTRRSFWGACQGLGGGESAYPRWRVELCAAELCGAASQGWWRRLRNGEVQEVPRACLKGGAGNRGRGWGRDSPVGSPEISAGRSAGKTILPGWPGWSVGAGVGALLRLTGEGH